jgi:hypothetical protein
VKYVLLLEPSDAFARHGHAEELVEAGVHALRNAPTRDDEELGRGRAEEVGAGLGEDGVSASGVLDPLDGHHLFL